MILAAVKVNFWLGFAAATIMILGAAYTLWMYKRVIYGEIANDHVASSPTSTAASSGCWRAVAAARSLDGRLAAAASST